MFDVICCVRDIFWGRGSADADVVDADDPGVIDEPSLFQKLSLAAGQINWVG
jgi:tRNA nucleotidyltransferase/poly(A) polymerase